MGMMSLGDMLVMAGYTVEECGTTPTTPPPPPGPVPLEYVDPVHHHHLKGWPNWQHDMGKIVLVLSNMAPQACI
eukprot:3440255-Karenia_brevis.AAC.1